MITITLIACLITLALCTSMLAPTTASELPCPTCEDELPTLAPTTAGALPCPTCEDELPTLAPTQQPLRQNLPNCTFDDPKIKQANADYSNCFNSNLYWASKPMYVYKPCDICNLQLKRCCSGIKQRYCTFMSTLPIKRFDRVTDFAIGVCIPFDCEFVLTAGRNLTCY
jgi:hypothetical protein